MKTKTVAIFLSTFVVSMFIGSFVGRPSVPHPDIGLTLDKFSAKHGYTMNEETCVTSDGYILLIHRIKCPKFKNSCKPGPPVLLLHGLLGSSVDFIAAKNQSLAFQLADKGYDVWMGNNRGNTFSRDHLLLDADSHPSFWDYSFHEIGVYDVPAMIDHVLATTNHSKLSYVGFSQGSTAFMVMASTKPEYCKKVKVANLMAPITTFYPTKSIILKVWSAFNILIETALFYIGHFEFMGDTGVDTMLLRYTCNGPHKITQFICTDILLAYGYGFSKQMNYDLVPFHMSLSPAGASTKQVQHIVQNRISGKFAPFDYYSKNPKIYGQETLPEYDLGKIKTPIAVYYGNADIFVDLQGLRQLIDKIPNIIVRYKVPFKPFSHADFFYSKNLSKLVYHKLMGVIDSYNN